jgi:hypothetical protein
MVRRIDRDLTLPTTEPFPEQQNVGERWAQELCDWLVKKIQLDGSRCWIVLDGFGNSNLPDETKRMVNSLIDAVDKRLPRVRLILLDYPLPLPRQLRPFVHTENLDEIDHPELEAFFQSVFRYSQIPHDDLQVQGVAAKILADLPENKEERMLEIMLRVIEAKEQLIPKE